MLSCISMDVFYLSRIIYDYSAKGLLLDFIFYFTFIGFGVLVLMYSKVFLIYVPPLLSRNSVD